RHSGAMRSERTRNDVLAIACRARGQPLDRIAVHHADCLVCQKFTTRSAVEGIRRAKFTRAPSMSAGAGTRFGPNRSKIKARTVAHSRPIVLPTIKIGSWRSPAIRRSRVAIFTPDIAARAATDSSYLWDLAKPSSALSFS